MTSVIQRVACLTLIALALMAGAITAEGGNVVFILDASGSMWAQMGKTTKIEVAKEVLTQQVEGLAAETRLGLVVYGHRKRVTATMSRSSCPWGKAPGRGWRRHWRRSIQKG